ncbi:MAG: beta family protein [bacterium]
MIKNIKYVPIIKTGDAEFRAVANLDKDLKSKFIPLFELTRGRKSKNDKTGEIRKRLDSLKKSYANFPFILDLTGEPELKNDEIINLYSNNNNYENWVKFCIEQKKELGSFYPVVQIQEEENYDDYIKKLTEQIRLLLSENFGYVVFRSQDEEFSENLIEDIETIIKSKQIEKIEEKIIFVLDYQYIVNSVSGIENAVSFINALEKLNIKNIVIASTSFPATVSEHMRDNYIALPIKERDFFNEIQKQASKKNINLIYGDYASINPKRNDTVTFAKGWIPRIDVPSKDMNIHSRRKRRDKTKEVVNNKIEEVFVSYKETYNELAQEVVSQNYFKNILKFNCWGINEIIKTSYGNVSGSSPRFWISVRMDIYINLIVNTIY